MPLRSPGSSSTTEAEQCGPPGRPLRVAYIVRWDVKGESGVLKKVVAQLERWREWGHSIALFALSPFQEVWHGAAHLPVTTVMSRGGWDRERAMRRLLALVTEWAPEIAYLRFNAHYWALEPFLERMPTVVELNTDDVAEYRLYLPRSKYWYHRMTRGRILARAAGLIGTSREIVEAQARFGKPATAISNGINLAAYPLLPPAPGPAIRVAFVGSDDAAWHGVDKILALAEALPQWRFDLVGPAGNALQCLPNVVTHGLLRRATYEAILAQADVAIGTLSLHVKRMQEASPLKVREYLAFGLPCIVGYRDTDFPDPVPFLLQLKNTPDNVERSVESIRAFAETWRGMRVDRRQVEHLDVSHKEAERLGFFAKVLARV